MVYLRHILPVHCQELIIDIQLVAELCRAVWDETTCERVSECVRVCVCVCARVCVCAVSKYLCLYVHCVLSTSHNTDEGNLISGFIQGEVRTGIPPSHGQSSPPRNYVIKSSGCANTHTHLHPPPPPPPPRKKSCMKLYNTCTQDICPLTYHAAWTQCVGLKHKAKTGLNVGSIYGDFPDALRRGGTRCLLLLEGSL